MNVVSLADFSLTNYKMDLPISPTFDIITGDALATMKSMAPASFDAIIFSPPYNLGWSEKGGKVNKFTHGSWKNAKLQNGYTSHNDAMPREEYVQQQKDILTECWRLLADDGAIFYQHKNRVQNGVLQTPHDLNPGLPLRQIVVWDRESGGMNHGEGFFTPAHEVIYVFAKPGFKYRKRAASLDVIKLAPAKDGHPAPYPVELPRRFIQALKPSATRILDPFSGSGSTGVAALREGRSYTGIELDPVYAEASRERLQNELEPRSSKIVSLRRYARERAPKPDMVLEPLSPKEPRPKQRNIRPPADLDRLIKNEVYRTPTTAFTPLLDYRPEWFEGIGSDPSAGDGRMIAEIVKRGNAGPHHLNDVREEEEALMRANVQGARITIGDYLANPVQPVVDFMITNPPFTLAVDFVKKARTHTTGPICILQSVAWQGTQKRSEWLKVSGLAYVLNLPRRPKWEVEVGKAPSNIWDFAWFVFLPDYDELPRMDWLL